MNLRRLPLARLRGGLYQEAWWKSTDAQKEGAAIHLEGADLPNTNLRSATLRSAHLEGALLFSTLLEGAALRGVHLGGKSLFHDPRDSVLLVQHPSGRLPPAEMRQAVFDGRTSLNDADVGDSQFGCVAIGDIHWNGCNAGVVNWSKVPMLGDEDEARRPRRPDGRRKERKTRRAELEGAVRANRQLAMLLRGQGANEDADRFAYRAQRLQRWVLRRQRHWLKYCGSFLLDILAGYGYRPLRSLITYVLVVLGFAAAYYLLGNNATPALDLHGALVFSVTSFHGRGFSPGGMLSPDNPLTTLAAGEAIIGLLIEITFIATCTQRFFAR